MGSQAVQVDSKYQGAKDTYSHLQACSDHGIKWKQSGRSRTRESSDLTLELN